jgi:hypothetical protein
MVITHRKYAIKPPTWHTVTSFFFQSSLQVYIMHLAADFKYYQRILKYGFMSLVVASKCTYHIENYSNILNFE